MRQKRQPKVLRHGREVTMFGEDSKNARFVVDGREKRRVASGAATREASRQPFEVKHV